MGAIRIFLFLLAVFCLGCESAHAEKRVALVIGNSAYKGVPRLANPVNDASLVGGMFPTIVAVVLFGRDADLKAHRRA